MTTTAPWPGWVEACMAIAPTDRDQPGTLDTIPDHLFKIWLVLARYANNDGFAWPSLNTICRRTGKDRRCVTRALAQGERLGLWTRTRSRGGAGGQTTEYRIRVPGASAPLLPGASAPLLPGASTPLPPGASAPLLPGVPTPLLPGASTPLNQGCPRPSTRGVNAPQNKPWNKPRNKERARAVAAAPGVESPDLPPALTTAAFRAAWAEWVAYRRQAGKRLTPIGVCRQIRMLADLGHDAAVASIHQSIEHGWAGLFTPRNAAAHPPPTHRTGEYAEPARPIPVIQP